MCDCDGLERGVDDGVGGSRGDGDGAVMVGSVVIVRLKQPVTVHF